MIKHRVREVDRASLAVGEATVVEHLQQHVEHVGVGLLDLVEQDDRVGPAAHGLGELTALVVADVAGRCADQPRHRVLLHVLAHVDAHHRSLVVEQELGERAGELGLADAGGAEEHERPDRSVGVGQAGPAATDRVRHGDDGVVLADDPLVQRVLEVDQLRHLDSMSRVIGTPVHLETTSAMSSASTSSFSIDCSAWRSFEVGGGLLDTTLQLGDPAVADLGGQVEVGLALDLRAEVLELLFQVADRVDRLLLGLPVLLHLGELHVELGELLVEGVEPLLGDRSSLSFSSATCSISSCRMRRPTTSISVGIESISMRSFEAASSTRSMALSGRNRLVR
jgi:hypothetical protein